MIKNKIKLNKGFVLIFAVTLSAILLSIALGVSQVAFREAKFSTSAKDTNDAFFSSDAGAECALFYDRFSQNQFPIGGGAVSFNCVTGTPVNATLQSANFWIFKVAGLGNSGQGCAIVTVDKTGSVASCPPPLSTCVVSRGYNNGGSVSNACTPSANTVERDLESDY